MRAPSPRDSVRLAPYTLHSRGQEPRRRGEVGLPAGGLAAALEGGDVADAGRQRAGPLAGQAHPEGGAAPGRRLDLDAAAEGVDELLGDVQAEAHAGAVRAGGPGLAEALEHVRQLGRVDARPLVLDLDEQLAHGAPGADPDGAAAAVALGVVDQVAHDLGEAVRVSAYVGQVVTHV